MRKIELSAVWMLICGLAFPAMAIEEMQTTVPAAASQAAQVDGAADDSVAQALNKTRLTFMDSKLFDAKLSRELASGKDMVEIEVTGRVSLNDIPPRMDRWVVKSAEEGKVELLPSEPAPRTRFIFSLIPMVFSAFGSLKNIQEERMFDYAKKYDTRIYYKKDDTGETLIEKIVMTRRKQN